MATERDLRDHFRMGGAETKARVAELVEAGELIPVGVRRAGGSRPSSIPPPGGRGGSRPAPSCRPSTT
ncbi:hypothetical protein WME91_19715 [Sorangium sp. So ce269]